MRARGGQAAGSRRPAAARHGEAAARTDVGDARDHLLEITLDDAVELEGLAGGGTQVALAVRVGEVVELAEDGGGDLAARHLEPQHELVALVTVGLLLELTVLLHVAPVVLEDVDRVLGDEDLVVGHVGQQRLPQEVALRLDQLHALLRLKVGPRLHRRVRWRSWPVLLTLDKARHIGDVHAHLRSGRMRRLASSPAGESQLIGGRRQAKQHDVRGLSRNRDRRRKFWRSPCCGNYTPPAYPCCLCRSCHQIPPNPNISCYFALIIQTFRA